MEALTRVIEEQQKRIDDLLEGNKKLIERSANVFKKNEELFEAMARLLDVGLTPNNITQKQWQEYATHWNEVRHQMWEAGYCLHCYNFVCQCDELE